MGFTACTALPGNGFERLLSPGPGLDVVQLEVAGTGSELKPLQQKQEAKALQKGLTSSSTGARHVAEISLRKCSNLVIFMCRLCLGILYFGAKSNRRDLSCL